MKKFFLAILSGLSAISSPAYDFPSMTDDDFRDAARSYVSGGNRAYDRSHRAGIMACADSLEAALRIRSDAGKLVRNDSLEFTADLLKLRGDWHYENGNYDSSSFSKAERYFLDALDIYESNPDLIGPLNRRPMIQREMAQLMYRTGRYGKALEYTDAACEAFAAAFDNGDFDETDAEYATMLELMSQKAMCMAREGNTHEALALMDELMKEYPRESEGYNEILRKKGKILMLSGGQDAEKQALGLYRQYMAWRKADALKTLGTMTSEERQDYWMRLRPFVADCYQLEDADPAFLYDVTLFAKGLLLQLNRMSGYGPASEEALRSLGYSWRQIQQRLPDGASAIEFVQYEKGGKDRMGAIVLTKTGTPSWIQMMEPETFMNYKISEWTNRERLFTTNGEKKNNMYNDTTLRAALWHEGLQRAVGQSGKIYFAPDGYLHQIGLEYMLPESMGQREMYRLTCTRRLMEDPQVRTDAALIVGGVKYDAADVDSGEGNDETAYSYMRDHRVSNFSYLPGSLTESNDIFYTRSCPNDTLLTGDGANELAFRSLCGHYQLLNISTHGYFGAATVPQGTDIKTSMSDESLSQCVIAMAGSNRNVSSWEFDPSRMDGLLSAKELSECDLSGVDLAVISACQTGLGYVTADGVFGIQRGLKNGGVKCLIVSLWNVSDKPTSLLMSRFHQRLKEGHTVHDAFMAARKSLSEKSGGGVRVFNAATLSEEVVEDDTYGEPQFCDAFILIDAIE